MAIVLYASRKKESDDQVEVVVSGFTNRAGEVTNQKVSVWVRAELKQNEWPGPAMTNAKPRNGEVALNAIPNE